MEPAKESPRLRTPIILGLILCLAAALRIYGLDFQSLWIDELATWRRSGFESIPEVLTRGVLTEIAPPAYHLLMHLMQKSAGGSESVLRLPSAIAGILGVWLIFLTGRKLYGDAEGLLAALFMAVMWCPILYSQEARAYQLLLLAGLAAVYFGIDLVRSLRAGNRPPLRITAAYTLCALLGAYLHYFGLYFIALQAGAALIAFRKDRRALAAWAAIYGLIAAGYLPWIPSLLQQIQSNTERAISWIPAPQAGDFIGYLLFIFNKSPFILAAAAMVYGLLFFRSSREERTGASPDLWLALWLIVPFWGAFLASYLWLPVLTFRNLIFAVPAAYLLLARGIMRLAFRPPLKLGIAAASGLALLAHLTVTMRYYDAPHKQQLREAVAHICAADQAAGKAGIVFVAPFKAMHFDYYCPRTSPREYCREKLSAPENLEAGAGAGQVRNAAAALNQAGFRRAWILFEPGAPSGEILDAFKNEGWPGVERENLFRVSAALLEKRDGPGA